MNLVTFCAILGVVVATFLFQQTESCSCMRNHPQMSFQQGSVFLVKIDEQLKGTDQHVETAATVEEVYKDEPGQQSFKKGDPIVLRDIRYCSIYVETAKKYLISGRVLNGKFERSICGLTIPWESVTEEQLAAFKIYLEVGNNCQIMHERTDISGNSTQCILGGKPEHQECQYNHGICVLKDGKCHWSSDAFEKCIAKVSENVETNHKPSNTNTSLNA